MANPPERLCEPIASPRSANKGREVHLNGRARDSLAGDGSVAGSASPRIRANEPLEWKGAIGYVSALPVESPQALYPKPGGRCPIFQKAGGPQGGSGDPNIISAF